MSRPFPYVGIVVDVKQIEDYPFHVVGEKYISAIANGCRCFPVILPAIVKGKHLQSFVDKFDITKIIADLDGLFLPGSVSNVHPSNYQENLETIDLPLDIQRDSTAITMIRSAIEQGVPMLAVCRGFQEFNVAYGGTIHQRLSELPDYIEHREDASLATDAQYDPTHVVTLKQDGLLHSIFGKISAQVNSLHGQGLNRLGTGLSIEARACDGLIEAITDKQAVGFNLGVQWHPEWNFSQDVLSKAIFDAFSKTVYQRFESR